MTNKIIRIDRMEPAKIDLTINQGAEFAIAFGFVGSLDPLTYIDTSTWEAECAIKQTYDSGNLAFMSRANGFITLGIQGSPPHQYNCLVSLGNASTDVLTFTAPALWDLEMIDPFGKRYRWVEGQVFLNRSVTR